LLFETGFRIGEAIGLFMEDFKFDFQKGHRIRLVERGEMENGQLTEAIAIQHLYKKVDGIYGYRRITLTINRQREKENLPKINKKRIYRLMHDSFNPILF